MNDKNRFLKMLFFFFINQTKKFPVNDFILLFSSSSRRKTSENAFKLKKIILEFNWNVAHCIKPW